MRHDRRRLLHACRCMVEQWSCCTSLQEAHPTLSTANGALLRALPSPSVMGVAAGIWAVCPQWRHAAQPPHQPAWQRPQRDPPIRRRAAATTAAPRPSIRREGQVEVWRCGLWLDGGSDGGSKEGGGRREGWWWEGWEIQTKSWDWDGPDTEKDEDACWSYPRPCPCCSNWRVGDGPEGVGVCFSAAQGFPS